MNIQANVPSWVSENVHNHMQDCDEYAILESVRISETAYALFVTSMEIREHWMVGYADTSKEYIEVSEVLIVEKNLFSQRDSVRPVAIWPTGNIELETFKLSRTGKSLVLKTMTYDGYNYAAYKLRDLLR